MTLEEPRAKALWVSTIIQWAKAHCFRRDSGKEILQAAIPHLAPKATLRYGAPAFVRFAGGLALVCLMLIGACSPPHPNHPVIGPKNFTEQVILSELRSRRRLRRRQA